MFLTHRNINFVGVTSGSVIFCVVNNKRKFKIYITVKCFPYNIPLPLLYKNIDLLGVNILNICNRSLAEGVFPNNLKVAKVIPIIKTDESESLNNYRPLSVLPSFSKI